ncbi:hypothetical protein [Deinococcus sp.]|uniref:hypothetical protein n=1 Tax=Deinococcus sp. TaxID=47478 RepID=UPI0025FA0A08|nr:hypothetical protein [Deinococcus sp.]
MFWDEQPRHLSGLWTVFDLPLGTKALKPVAAASRTVSGGKAATNELGQQGFTAPCAAGKHNIYVDFYALDVASLNLPVGTPLQAVHAAIKRHNLLEAKAHVFLVNP